jgi:hypothetical protein
LARVLLLLDSDDVSRALIAGEEILSVLGIEEFSQRLDATDDEQQIVLAFECEHRVNEIVPRAAASAVAPAAGSTTWWISSTGSRPRPATDARVGSPII